MPAPYPQEFRDDVVAVARGREPGVTLKQIAEDFGISEASLTNWLKAADVEDGKRPGVTKDVNPPGESGDSVPWEGWSHVREYVEEVPGRVA